MIVPVKMYLGKESCRGWSLFLGLVAANLR